MVRRPPKSEGRDHLTRFSEAGGIPSFNPAQRRPAGKYMCRTSMGGCGHRHARQPESLCDECQARHAEHYYARAAADERDRQAQLARRRFGEGWDDYLNWLTDHALAPARTPREHADRRRAAEAGRHIGVEQRARQQAGARLPWEEHPPRRPGTDPLARASSALRRIRRAAADRIEVNSIEDPALREMLTRWRATR
jgi:hypothetical protein